MEVCRGKLELLSHAIPEWHGTMIVRVHEGVHGMQNAKHLSSSKAGKCHGTHDGLQHPPRHLRKCQQPCQSLAQPIISLRRDTGALASAIQSPTQHLCLDVADLNFISDQPKGIQSLASIVQASSDSLLLQADYARIVDVQIKPRISSGLEHRCRTAIGHGALGFQT